LQAELPEGCPDSSALPCPFTSSRYRKLPISGLAITLAWSQPHLLPLNGVLHLKSMYKHRKRVVESTPVIPKQNASIGGEISNN
jgi:hypothetical protein